MRRRSLLAAGLGLVCGSVVASAHTPFNQWVVYRRRHLLILTSKSDPGAYELGQEVAAVLARHLPESKARPSRAASLERLASLIASEQMDVTLLSRGAAEALHSGAAPFSAIGPVPLRALFDLGGHLLLSRADFPAGHAHLIAQTLDRARAELPVAGSLPASHDGQIPPHAGLNGDN